MTKALTYVEADVDFCSLTWGVLPCLARFGYSGGQTGPNAVNFDGTDTVLKRGAAITGATDSKQVTGSFWFRRQGGLAVAQTIFALETAAGGATNHFAITLETSNVLRILGTNAAGTTILDVRTSAFTIDNQWHHVLFSFDLTSTSKRWIYVDDVSQLTTVTTYTNDTLDFTLLDASVGAEADGTLLLNADLADLWVAPGTYLDLSVFGNRRFFIDGTLRPVYLGSTGQTPTGSSPAVFLSNSIATWKTNLGTGGGFTLTGTLASVVFATGTHKCFNTRATCQSKSTFTNAPVTLRWAIPTDYLPLSIDCIPSIDSVAFTPAVVSLGVDLGQRATLRVTFTDHKWPDTGPGYDKYLSTRPYNPFNQGTYFGKFRARQQFLKGRPLRLIRGTTDQALADMDTRHYVIDSFTGPTPDGKYTIVAKDVLSLTTGDQAQAPKISNGYLVADIDAAVSELTLTPSGVGNSEYPQSGWVSIGGKEIVSFMRDLASGNDSNALLVVHFDGVDNSTAITDASSFSRPATIVGAAKIDTAQAKFGSGSGLFASGSAITFLDSADWTFSGDFTLEAWVNANTLAANSCILSHNTNSSNLYHLFVSSTGVVTFEVRSGGPVILTYSSAAGQVSTGAWHHVAVVRTGNNYVTYVDGVSVATLTSATAIPNFSNTFDIGNNSFGNSWVGWIDEVRVSKVARYASAFTPSTTPFEVSPDVLSIIRAQFNTDAVAHSAQDRVQLCIYYLAEDPALIIADLFENYAGISSALIPISAWQTETSFFLRTVYTALLAQPTAVNVLVSELIEQAALAIWWDDRSQLLQLQVLRAISTGAYEFNPDNYLDQTFNTAEQPDKRISQVWTYFAQRNPLAIQTDASNYRSAIATVDLQAETDYGAPAIKSIFSRWIPAFGRSVAQRLNQIQLGRFRNPPRQIGFSLIRYGIQDAQLGAGYQIKGWTLQDETGALVDVPIQVTQLTPDADKLTVIAEEMLFISYDSADLNNRAIIIDNDSLNLNIRTIHDTLYPPPVAGITVNITVIAGVDVGSASMSTPAMDIGSWPAGVTLNLVVQGRIQGCGGQGDTGGGGGTGGFTGGTALFTRVAINADFTGGQIWAGGGGGGRAGQATGGGGAGYQGGLGGLAGAHLGPGDLGLPGTRLVGGLGGGQGTGIVAGQGGGPGLDGVAAVSAGGSKGNSIDGVSFLTISHAGDRRGNEVN